MSYELTKEEKTTLINQHLKNLEYSAYNLELSILEENALATPNATTVASLNAQVAEINAKRTALQGELDELTA